GDLGGAGARVHGDGVLGADIGREPFLELAPELAQRELARGEALVDLLEDGGPVLRWKVHGRRWYTHRCHSGTCADIGDHGNNSSSLRRDAGQVAWALRHAIAPGTTLSDTTSGSFFPGRLNA